MIDQIFELIMKEARTRKGQGLELSIFMVLLEVQARVFEAFKPLKVDDIKTTRLKFRRKVP